MTDKQTYEITSFPTGIFPHIVKEYEEHDKTCSSIPHIWMGRKGGVSDMWSQMDCDTCGVCFYTEGIIWYEGTDDGKIEDRNLCDCCNRKSKK